MLYTFRGGPLDGETKEIPPDKIVEGIYTTYKLTDAEGLALIGDIIEHRYLAINEELHWLTPEKL